MVERNINEVYKDDFILLPMIPLTLQIFSMKSLDIK